MSFGTEIEWSGAWNSGGIRHARPVITTGLEIAHEKLLEEQVTAGEKRTCRVFQVGRDINVAGVSHDAQRFDLYVPRRHIKHRKLHLLEMQFPGNSLHEMLHCVRFEHFPHMTLAEAAFTEGISYVAEDELEYDLFGTDGHIPLKHYLPEFSSAQLGSLYAEFAAMDPETTHIDELSEAQFDYWDDLPMRADTFASRLDVLGILAVNGLRMNGAQLVDIIGMEPMLGIKAGLSMS